MIIAIIPAPGHEGLVAEGPMGERPALLEWGTGVGGKAPCCGSRAWRVRRCPVCSLPFVRSPHRRHGYSAALVLHAPGDPRLGMVRLMEALFGGDADDADFTVDHGTGEAAMIDRNGDTLADWEIPPMPAAADGRAFAAAHLAVQRGIASEVLVLP